MTSETEICEMIRSYFGDTSRPASETKEGLGDMVDLCEEFILAIDADEAAT
jgi:hypothetical protein